VAVLNSTVGLALNALQTWYDKADCGGLVMCRERILFQRAEVYFFVHTNFTISCHSFAPIAVHHNVYTDIINYVIADSIITHMIKFKFIKPSETHYSGQKKHCQLPSFAMILYCHRMKNTDVTPLQELQLYLSKNEHTFKTS